MRPTNLSKATSAESQKKKGVIEVIVDSNALFAPLQFKIDIYGELERILNRRFELILLSPVLKELQTLASEGRPKIRKMAAFAIEFAEKCRYVEVRSLAKT